MKTAFIVPVLAALLLALPGCGVPGNQAGEAAAGNVPAAASATAAEAYTAYLEAKSAVMMKLSDALPDNEEKANMAMLGVSRMDLALLPVSFFGAGEEAAAAGLAMLGASGVTYGENGGSYTVSYSDSAGAVHTFSGAYDAAADALVCTAQKDGADYLYAEYRKSPFGYVSQCLLTDENGNSALYLFAVSGESGGFGVSRSGGARPAALTGGESPDFFSALPEWYAISGSDVTGVASNGAHISFEYIPSAK